MSIELHVLDEERQKYNEKLARYCETILKNRVLDMENCDFKDLVENKIDYTVLREIFAEFFAQYRVKCPDLSILDSSKIYEANDKDIGGYNSDADVIFLNYKKTEERSKEAKLVHGAEISTDLILLKTYIHEVVHAVSKIRTVVSVDSPTVIRTVELGGFRLVSLTTENGRINGPYDVFFVDLDEGVTELISGMIFQEYCRRTKAFSDKELNDFNRLDPTHKDETVILVKDMVAFLVEEGGSKEEEVWRKIVEGKFDGVEKIVDWLDKLKNVFPEDYLYFLAENYGEALRLSMDRIRQDSRELETEALAWENSDNK